MSDDDVFDQTTKQNMSFLKAEADNFFLFLFLFLFFIFIFYFYSCYFILIIFYSRSNRAMHKETILLLYTLKVR